MGKNNFDALLKPTNPPLRLMLWDSMIGTHCTKIELPVR